MPLASTLPFDTSSIGATCPNTFDRSFSAVIFLISLCLNLTFLDLIRRHTNLSIRPYKRVLIICTVSDLLASLFSFLFAVKVYVVNNKQLILSFDGPLPYIFYKFHWIGPFGLNILTWSFEMTILYICGFSFIPFVYRYQLICKNKPLTNGQLISINIFLLILSFLVSITQLIRSLFNTRVDLFVDYYTKPSFECLHLALDYNLVFSPKEMFYYYFYYGNYTFSYIIMVVFLCLYGVSFYCGWNISRFLRRKKCLPTTIRSNNQINLTLIIQSTVPILLIGLPYSFNVIIKILSLNRSQAAFDWMLHGVTLIPCLNPLMAMIMLSCYRRIIFNKLGLTTSSRVSSVATVTNVNINLQNY